jgi:hypothetical protein
MLRNKWPLFILIIAIVYAVWIILLLLELTPGYVRAYQYFGIEQWLYLGTALFIIFITIMIWKWLPVKPEIHEKAPVIIEAEPVYSEEKLVISYPKGVNAAVYVDTFVELDRNTELNLRTFLGRSCLFCEHREKCWDEYKEVISIEKFLASIDCFKTKSKST